MKRVALTLPLAALLACSSTLDVGDGCESDAAFCARLGRDCASVTAEDECGRTRTVNCGSCTSPQVCGAHDRANVCGYQGIAWTSGATTQDPKAFGEWRKQPVKVVGIWIDGTSWDGIEAMYGVDGLGLGVAASVAVPLTPTTEGDLASCAAGDYDGHFQAAAAALVDRLAAQGAAARSYVRLGWQDNAACQWCPTNTDEDAAWKACFRRAAAAFRAASSALVIVWDMNRRFPGDVSRLWPGDDAVDVVAVDFYDMAPHFLDAASWKQDLFTTVNDGPRGLESWVGFARQHGKKLALPEWGLSALDGTEHGDNPYFVERMYDFFWFHAADLEYEAFFNAQGKNYEIFPLEGIQSNPNAGAQYKLLWTPPS